MQRSLLKKLSKNEEVLDRDEMEQLRLLLRKHSYGASGFNPQKNFSTMGQG